MVRKPFNFDWWLDYHFSLGVDYIFLRVEDTPDLKNIVDKYSNVFTIFDNDSNKRNNYWTQMNRQKMFINSIKNELIEKKVDWLFHIDSDELICCNNLKSLLESVPNKYDTIHFDNYEAVYDNDDLENPFIQTNRFRFGNSRISYRNGKSAARVNQNLRPKGPHKFYGNRLEMPPIKLVILHYESATFDSWWEKFNNDNDNDIEKLTEIPFGYYKESIDIVTKRDKETARIFYNKMKVNIEESTMKLSWTPHLENKNVSWSN